MFVYCVSFYRNSSVDDLIVNFFQEQEQTNLNELHSMRMAYIEKYADYMRGIKNYTFYVKHQNFLI